MKLLSLHTNDSVYRSFNSLEFCFARADTNNYVYQLTWRKLSNCHVLRVTIDVISIGKRMY
jgi:hypothetical protein